MNPARLDIHTIINLMAIGNISFALILFAYKNNSETVRASGFFVISKILQTLAWILLGLRGQISDLLSINVGNILLILGFALETLALTTVRAPSRRREMLHGALALAGILAWLAFGRAANTRVAWASLGTLVLFGTAAACLLREAAGSRLRGAVGLLYLAFCGSLALRAVTAFRAGPDFQLMSWSWAQMLSFCVLYFVLVTGGVVFLLLQKELSDQERNESELQYRTLVEKATESILIIADGRIAFANPAVARTLATPLEAVLGQEFLRFVHPDDRAGLAGRYRQRLRGEGPPDGYDFRFVGPGGQEGWGSVSATRVTWRGQPATLNLMTDITARKRLEREREGMLGNLQRANSEVKILSGLLPICASCKKIRDDQGYWYQLESYIVDHSEAVFTHGICPDCRDELYPALGRARRLLSP